MNTSTINCWEYCECGREKECPAYPDNGRRCCYIKGTFCMVSRGPDHKKDCNDCGFFRNILWRPTNISIR